MLYFVIILVSMLAIEGISILCAGFNLISLQAAIWGPIITNFYVLGAMGLITLVCRIIMPPKTCNPTKKFFVVNKKEIKVYNKLKIKLWKDKVPEMGCAGGFKKDKIESLNPSYLSKFLKETCFAEVIHRLSALLSFIVLIFANPVYYVFMIPVLVVNFVLHILPCLIQRYNRFRISKIYLKQCKNVA